MLMNQYLHYYLSFFFLWGMCNIVQANDGTLIIYTNSDTIYSIYRNDHPYPPGPLNYNILIKSDSSGALLDLSDISLFVKSGYEIKLEGNTYLHARSSFTHIGSKDVNKGESLKKYFAVLIAKKVENWLTIFAKEAIQEYIIYDMKGREISRQTLIPSSTSVEIFTGYLHPGVYKIKVISESGITDTQSIIK